MSEFKFACPVCGQHITANSNASGTQLECPTCFQKIVVPQAPAAGDSKFILEAAQAGKPRSVFMETQAGAGATKPAVDRKSPSLLVPLGFLLGVACTAAVGYHFWPRKPNPPPAQPAPQYTNATPQPAEVMRPDAYPVPTNAQWTLDLAAAKIPDEPAAGRIHGHGFRCEKATLLGANLGLRQGKNGPPDLGVNIAFYAGQGEELSGKTISVQPDRAPPLPKVTLRWKEEQDNPVNKTYNSGYALTVVFGQAANGRIPGKLYLAFSDEARSFVAGTFDADIRKPRPPR
jgi:hypothetical protein